MRKAWEWITANTALRKALKRGVSPTTLSKLLMFSHECLLTSCFRSRSCHQGGFFSFSQTFQLQQLADPHTAPAFEEFVSLLNIHLFGFVQQDPSHTLSFVSLRWDYLARCCLQVHDWHGGGAFIMTTPMITRSCINKHEEILIWAPRKGAEVMQMSIRRVCQWKTPLIVFDSCFYLGFTFCLPLLSRGMLRADYTSFGLAITWRTPPHQPLITNPHYRCQIHGGIFNPTHGSRSSSETLQQQHVNHLAWYHTSC